MNDINLNYFLDYFNNSKEAFIITNLELKIQFVNVYCLEQLTNSGIYDFSEKNFYNLIYSEDTNILSESIEHLKINAISKQITLRLFHNSKIYNSELTLNFIKDKNQNGTGYLIKIDFLKDVIFEIRNIIDKKGDEYFENYIEIINKHIKSNYIEIGIVRDEGKKICKTVAVLVNDEIISNFSYSLKNLLPSEKEEYYVIDIKDNYKHHILHSFEDIKQILIYPIYNIYKELLAIITVDITNHYVLLNQYVNIFNQTNKHLLNRIEHYIFEKELEKLHLKLEIKKREFEQIIYITSHDLRSPLVNIQGFTSELNNGINKLLKKISNELNLTNEINEIVKEDIDDSLMYIKTSIEKMDNLLNGLLKLSRLVRARLNYEMLDLNTLIKRTIDLMPNEQKKDVIINIKDLPFAYADKNSLEEVFEHLISNSLKYLRADREGIINIWGKNLEDENLYCIEDNGIGIDKSKYEKIFEMFYKIDPNKSNGIGIGLTIAKKMLEKNKGNIWVESSEDNTKFYFTLPAKE